MLRRLALLLWLAPVLGCPAESASQAAVVKPALVEAKPEAKNEATVEAPGDGNCCGAEGPVEVALPPETDSPAK